MENKIILGIDPGTQSSPTGLAIVEISSNIPRLVTTNSVFLSDEVIKFISSKKSSKDKTSINLIWQIRHIVSQIANWIRSYQVTDVICEEPFLLGKANKNMLKFFGVLEYVLIDFGLRPIYINPSTSKKLAVGHGGADKEAMAVAVNSFFKLKDYEFPTSPDATDAAAVIIAHGVNQKWWMPDYIPFERL